MYSSIKPPTFLLRSRQTWKCWNENWHWPLKRIEPARIRTWNLLIRSQTRYPLRHRSRWRIHGVSLHLLQEPVNDVLCSILQSFFSIFMSLHDLNDKYKLHCTRSQNNKRSNISVLQCIKCVWWWDSRQIQRKTIKQITCYTTIWLRGMQIWNRKSTAFDILISHRMVCVRSMDFEDVHWKTCCKLISLNAVAGD